MRYWRRATGWLLDRASIDQHASEVGPPITLCSRAAIWASSERLAQLIVLAERVAIAALSVNDAHHTAAVGTLANATGADLVVAVS